MSIPKTPFTTFAEAPASIAMQIAQTLTKKYDNELTSNATPEELVECARVLALSLAEHRAHFGVIPLVHGAARVEAHAATKDLASAASGVLNEALALIRAPAKSSPKPNLEPSMPHDRADKRRQLRVSVTAPVQVSDPDGTWQLAATVSNISWGGAAIQCTGLKAELGHQLRLHLPAGGGNKITILATVLRIHDLAEGSEFGLRFDSLSPADEARLQQVLALLVSKPQPGRRSEARLVQRFEIEYGDVGEFRATLEDISVNGLMLMTPEPLEINQSLLISLTSADTEFNLSLRARVMHQTEIGEGDFKMYRVGLQFEHSNEQVRDQVTAVISQLATLRPAGISPPATNLHDLPTAGGALWERL
ncbi:MAG: PilZ domain-containing protein [Gammaproteobacteria bacterium]|nr:PilZ domain-containing protein [Gammaproteobacteria bacterium]